MTSPGSRIAVSTWSVHKHLGLTYHNGPGALPSPEPQPTFGAGDIAFLDLPGELAKRGYFRAEICHFHLASQDAGYLAEVKAAFRAAGVVIQTLLIDDGDITNPSIRARDLAWIERFIATTGVLGAENARVIAGKQKPTAETLALSVTGLASLVPVAKDHGVRLVTENWFDLLATEKEVHHVLDAVGDGLGFLADMGNWHGSGKYAALRSVYSRAELSHTKCHFGDGLAMDRDDYGKCLEASVKAGYEGPHTLIFESPGEEWDGLAMEREFVLGYLGA
jgi:sugar phosphate isomerase/epimerase